MRVSKKLEKLEKFLAMPSGKAERTLRSKLSTILLCAALFTIYCSLFTIYCSLFTSCSTEDDKIVVQTQHKWVDKKVAVVYPTRNPIMKAQLERTAQW